MANENELDMDSIMVPDDEKVVFSDAPKVEDATPAATPPVDPPADVTKPEGDDIPPDDQQETPEQREARRAKKRKTLQQRVSELTRLRHEAEEREAAVLARNEVLEAQARELQERHQRVTTESLTQREADLVARKKQALEEQDMVAYDAASTELLELKLQTRAVDQPAPVPQRQAQPDAEDDMHPSAKAWVTRNDWYSKPENRHLASEALRIEARLRKEGMQYGDELYKKLDEAIAELPDFDDVRGVQAADDEPVDPRPTGRPVVTPPSRGAEPPPAKPRAGALTEMDKQTMRRFKLDPNKPEHRETYLKYKS